MKPSTIAAELAENIPVLSEGEQKRNELAVEHLRRHAAQLFSTYPERVKQELADSEGILFPHRYLDRVLGVHIPAPDYITELLGPHDDWANVYLDIAIGARDVIGANYHHEYFEIEASTKIIAIGKNSDKYSLYTRFESLDTPEPDRLILGTHLEYEPMPIDYYLPKDTVEGCHSLEGALDMVEEYLKGLR